MCTLLSDASVWLSGHGGHTASETLIGHFLLNTPRTHVQLPMSMWRTDSCKAQHICWFLKHIQ